ncbi:hypothetical protein A6C57_06930 [Fibrella sp. ES10-3-2-2]|nr:hypothetical protein A6C57_06930 [Fibrella sp. ES10-3-2-2]
MQSKLSKDEVKEILLRVAGNGLTHAQNYYNCIAQGDADFVSMYGTDPILSNGAKAHIRNSKILYYVRQLMVEDTVSYVHLDDHNAFYVRVEGRLHLRFKKLDKFGRSAAGKTGRDKRFRLQDSECLPFVDKVSVAVNMDVGYTLDQTGTLTEISFSCSAPHKRDVPWRLRTKDLQINESQMQLIPVTEDDIIPVFQLDVKEHLKKKADGKQSDGAV